MLFDDIINYCTQYKSKWHEFVFQCQLFVGSDGCFIVLEKLFELPGDPTTLTFDDRGQVSVIFGVDDSAMMGFTVKLLNS